MYERLVSYFLLEPRRLIGLGQLLARAGGMLMFLGIVGRAATATVSTVQGMATHSRPGVTLADVFPGFLSWCIPESAFGFAIALVLVVAGICAVEAGRRLERFLRY